MTADDGSSSSQCQLLMLRLLQQHVAAGLKFNCLLGWWSGGGQQNVEQHS
jgi:hypothetical protein